RGAALSESREAVVRGIVGQSEGLRGTRRDLAVLLALAAYRIEPREDTLGALMSAVNAESGLDRTSDGPVSDISNRGMLANGTTYAAIDELQGVRLIDIRSGRQIGVLPPAQSTINSNGVAAVSHDGRYLALASSALGDPGKLTVWDLATRTRRYPDHPL